MGLGLHHVEENALIFIMFFARAFAFLSPLIE